MDDRYLNLPNFVPLSDAMWHFVSLNLMVGYGACFAFIIYFLMTATQLAPRYRLVAVLSAVVMASAGLSLFREWSMWSETFSYAADLGQWVPLTEGQTFSNAYRYGNWTITVPLLLIQLPLALGLSRPELHKRSLRMIIAGVAMIWTGLVGQFGEVADLGLFNLWGVISTLFFFWLLFEVFQITRIGATTGPEELRPWAKNLWWYMLFTWGLYPIAYALPQLGATETVVAVQQLLFTTADITTKLVYGVILSRYCLRRGALQGYMPSQHALDDTGLSSAIASHPED